MPAPAIGPITVLFGALMDAAVVLDQFILAFPFTYCFVTMGIIGMSLVVFIHIIQYVCTLLLSVDT